jgi:hypothetical protein
MGGSSKTPSATTQTTKTELPSWLDNAAQEYVGFGREVAQRPYEAYQGQQIADFSQDQANAFQGVRDQQGVTGGALTNLAGQAQGIAGYQPQTVQGGSLPNVNLSGYMNPYIDTVAKNAMAGIDTQRQMAQNGLADQAQAANAYGGSRFALQSASLDAQAAQQAGNMQAQLYGQGFQNAQQMAQQDMTRGLQAQGMNQQAGLAAQNLGLQGLGLAGQFVQGAQQGNYRDLAALEAVGGQQQGMNQQRLDLAQQQWQDARNYPLEQLGIMQSVMGSTPYGGSTISSGVAPQTRANPAMGALGGAMSGAASGTMIGGPGWGTAIGAVVGAGAGYLGSR